MSIALDTTFLQSFFFKIFSSRGWVGFKKRGGDGGFAIILLFTMLILFNHTAVLSHCR